MISKLAPDITINNIVENGYEFIDDFGNKFKVMEHLHGPTMFISSTEKIIKDEHDKFIVHVTFQVYSKNINNLNETKSNGRQAFDEFSAVTQIDASKAPVGMNNRMVDDIQVKKYETNILHLDFYVETFDLYIDLIQRNLQIFNIQRGVSNEYFSNTRRVVENLKLKVTKFVELVNE